MKIETILRKTRNLLQDTWVGHFPDFFKGEECVISALARYDQNNFNVVDNYLKSAANIKQLWLHEWNDSSTKEEVLAAFDKAIKKAKKEGI